MYLEHFGLSEAPFRITPHTDFFFSGANRGATLDALLYAITHDEGIVKVSGEVGSGKTMLCRVLMERLPQSVVIIYLANPSLSRDDILFAIADELGLAIPDSARTSAVLRSLQEHLIALYGDGRQVVVLIDEAHAMPAETLEEIRLLSNLETNRHKLLQLVLFGQPELNDILARPEMRQLKERITHNFTLEPLVRDDIAQYLDFRLRAAGYRGPELFNVGAIRLITGISQGLTRRINILADKSLLAAFAGNGHQVTPKQVRAAIRDSEFADGAGTAWRRAGLAAGLLVLGLASAAFLAWRPEAPSQPAPAATPAVPPATPAVPPAPGPQRAAVAPPAPTALAPAPAPAAPAVPAVAPHDAEPAIPATAPAADLAGLKPQTRRLVGETRTWLDGVADNQWFIQLLATDAHRADFVEGFVGKASALVNDGQLRVYTVKLDGERRIGVIYGQFETRQAAAQAISGLPQALQIYKPFPRQVRRLR
ncbi:MAG TPA: AAA family ATPase [Rhodocyclaceae bacterium]|nr:AAA family ATPase [Rhodocyclaceae bacterium]